MVHWKYPGSLNDCQSGPNTTRARQKIVLAWGSFPNLNFEPKFFVEVFRSNTHILNTEASVLVYYFNFITRAIVQYCPSVQRIETIQIEGVTRCDSKLKLLIFTRVVFASIDFILGSNWQLQALPRSIWPLITF